MKSHLAGETIWKRFRDDDHSSWNVRWGMLVLVFWIAVQAVFASDVIPTSAGVPISQSYPEMGR